MNRFYSIEALIFSREFFCFPIIHYNSNIFKSSEFVIQISEYPDICVKAGTETVNGNLTT